MAKVVPEGEVERRRRVPPWSLTIWLLRQSPTPLPPGLVVTKGWKLALLSLEFFASGLLLCLLVIVGRQYYMMAALDMGFEYKNLAHVDLSGVPQNQREALVSELRNLGCVESV